VTPPTILFDIDGTLVRFDGLGRASMARAMEEVWGLRGALEGISFAGTTDGWVAARVGPGLDREAMWARYVEHLRAAAAARRPVSPLEGVVPLLDALAAEGARLGLLTGNVRAGAEIKLSAAGILDRFDLSISGFAEDGNERTEIAASARRRCGEIPLTVVGDTVADIRGARHIGARALAVAWGFEEADALRAEEPDRLVPALSPEGGLVEWLLARPS
jgi:phosphoglycolate phosphatase-like HAD superfamily hydrolase